MRQVDAEGRLGDGLRHGPAVPVLPPGGAEAVQPRRLQTDAGGAPLEEHLIQRPGFDGGRQRQAEGQRRARQIQPDKGPGPVAGRLLSQDIAQHTIAHGAPSQVDGVLGRDAADEGQGREEFQRGGQTPQHEPDPQSVVQQPPVRPPPQRGGAVVTLAAMINALKLTGRKLDEIRVVTSGAGAAGIAIIRLLIAMGLKDVILCDRKGAIYQGREGLNAEKEEMAAITNKNCLKGSLADVLKGADVFIGVSAPGCVTPEMVKSMAPDPILFPMANPVPEIMPDLAKAAGAAVVGTGRSDFPNQINNVLAFPGIFRGALDVRARDINDDMKIAAAQAIAAFVTEEQLSAEYIIPSALDRSVAQAVAKAVAQAARDSGVARI